MVYVRTGAGDRAEEWSVEMLHFPATPIEHADLGTSYSERVTSYRRVVDFSKIPANQIRLYFYGKSNESGGDVEVYDVTNSQQLCEIENLANSDAWADSGWTDLPSSVPGTEITVTLRHKGSSGTEDIDCHRAYLKLRRN